MREVVTCLISAFIGLMALGVVAALVTFAVGAYARSSQLLSSWAASNGYRIVESERRTFAKGPFFWTSSQSQIIYRVTVQDVYGNMKRGWVRCGSYLLGPWKNKVDVRWDG